MLSHDICVFVHQFVGYNLHHGFLENLKFTQKLHYFCIAELLKEKKQLREGCSLTYVGLAYQILIMLKMQKY